VRKRGNENFDWDDDDDYDEEDVDLSDCVGGGCGGDQLKATENQAAVICSISSKAKINLTVTLKCQTTSDQPNKTETTINHDRERATV